MEQKLSDGEVASANDWTGKCEGCGGNFKPRKEWQKYCHKKCANKARMTRYWKKKLGL